MKNCIVFAILLTFATGLLQVHAQNTFAPLGAEWWYQGDNFNYTSWPGGLTEPNKTWTDHVQVVKDTTINTIDCRKVVVTRTYKSGAYGDSLFTEKPSELFIYDNVDTVFIYNKEYTRFLPLYVFNVSAGDTVQLLFPGANQYAKDSMYLIIDSVVFENFDENSFKSIYTRVYKFYDDGLLQYSINYGSRRGIHDMESIGKYTQKLGILHPTIAGLLPYYTTSMDDEVVNPRHPSGKLVCYKDGDNEIHFSEHECDYIPTPVLGIKHIKQKLPLLLSPNPAYNEITIEGKERMPAETMIKVYDLSGRTVLPLVDFSAQQKVSIDIRQLPEGLYVVRVEGRDHYSYHKLVVQR